MIPVKEHDTVETNQGTGTIIHIYTNKRAVLIELDDNEIRTIVMEDILKKV